MVMSKTDNDNDENTIIMTNQPMKNDKMKRRSGELRAALRRHGNQRSEQQASEKAEISVMTNRSEEQQ